jgi:hypothetical protein
LGWSARTWRPLWPRRIIGAPAAPIECELKCLRHLIYSRARCLANPVVTQVETVPGVRKRFLYPQRDIKPSHRTVLASQFTKSVSNYPFAAM